MQMRWHKIQLACPSCKQEPTITDISVSADGEVLIEMVCSKCQAQLQMLTTGTRLAMQSLYYDIEACEEKKQPKQKLLAPPPPPDTSAADDKWLGEMGIGGE